MKHYFFILMGSFAINTAFGQADSLVQKLNQSEGAERIDVLHAIVRDLWLNYPKQAMQYGEEALELSRQQQDSFLISQSLRFIAGVYYYQGDYEQSLDHNIEALELAMQLRDSALINNSYNNIGLLYYHLGNYQVALEYLLRGKTIKDKIGQTYGLSTTLNNIGLIFERISQYQQARDYFLEAYRVAEKYQEQDIRLYSINNIGITYLKEAKLDAAMAHFKNGAELASEIENINWGSVSQRGIGEVLLLQGDVENAKSYFLRSLQMSEEINDKKGIAEANYLLAKQAKEAGQFDEALEYLERSDRKARQLQLRQQQLDNLKLYADIYLLKGNQQEQGAYLRKFVALNDSLLQDAVSRNLSLIPLKLKEEEDRLKFSQQQSELKSQLMVNDLFTLAIILVVPLVAFLVILLRKNARKAEALQAYNDDLMKAQNLLITQEKMASLGVLAAGVGHEINNPLNFIKNGVEALSQYIKLEKGEQDPQIESYLRIVDEGVVRATKIVSSLSHFSRAGQSRSELCKINEIIENCLLILHNKIRDRIQIVTVFDDGVELLGNEGRLHQVILNILANAAQAIEDKGTIEIATKRESQQVVIEISDDGPGIPKENLTKIQDPFFTTKPPGEGTGLGLFITSTIIEEHNGKMEVQSQVGIGSRFTITLPID